MGSSSRTRWRFLSAGALVSAGFALGVIASTASSSLADSQPSPYVRLNTFAKVMSYIERSYYEPVKQEKLVDAAIKGMVGHLDPHSAYLTPEEYRALREETDGEFVGVGVEIGKQNGYIRIVTPLEGAPSDRAGVEPGDLVISVDGASTHGLTLRQTIKRLKGVEGSKVTLEVLRPTSVDPSKPVNIRGATQHTFELTREVINVVSVSGRLMSADYGYVRIRSFQQAVSLELEETLDRLERENRRPLKGIVLDLRNNPGGLLTEAVKTVDLFVDAGVVVTTENRGRQRVDRYEASRPATRFDGALAVMVNAGSASASEIVAGAVQDHQRGPIVGARSFGKGSVQSIIDMKDGSGLKLTTAHYFTPAHRSIHASGIKPDLAVTSAKVSPSDKASGPWFTGDKQLEAAYEAIRRKPAK